MTQAERAVKLLELKGRLKAEMAKDANPGVGASIVMAGVLARLVLELCDALVDMLDGTDGDERLPGGGRVAVALSRADVELLDEALDSHVYWQLADPDRRRDGYVFPPGTDDPDKAAEIKDSRRLARRLNKALGR